MTNYECGRALVYIAEVIIKTFGEDFGIEGQEPNNPYIEDEDVRKALKWWAVSNGITKDASLLFVGASNGFTCENQYISFNSAVYDMSEKLVSGNTYELGKLLGEDE